MELSSGENLYKGPIARWFAPPVLDSAESTRQARSVWLVTWPLLGFGTLVLAIMGAVEPATIQRRAITIAAIAVLVTALHEVSRRGRPRLASWLLVIGLVVIITQRATNTGGIHAQVAVFYTIFVILAGLLLGVRAGVVTAIVCFAGATLLTVAHLLEWLPPGPRPALSGLVFVTLTLGLTLIVQNLMASQPTHERQDGAAARMLSRRAQVSNGNASQSGTSVRPVVQGQRQPTDVVATVRAALNAFKESYPDREITLRAESPVTCRSRPAVVQLVLDHLLSNAVQHGGAGRIEVRVSAADSRACIAVQDEGPGIPDVWRRFISDAPGDEIMRPARNLPPSGLGLMLCKVSVEAVGGTIRIESAQSRGSVVIVELPA